MVTEKTERAIGGPPRVATRQGVGGHSEERRRRFQAHLLLFLAVNMGLVGVDKLVLAPPGIQWAQWILIPWLFVFLTHILALKTRGFPWLELIVPPKKAVIKEVYTEPLAYEMVRSRQLRDGVAKAAEAVRAANPALADDAISAADELLDAAEKLVAVVQARSEAEGTGAGAGADAQDVTELQAALTELNELHQGLIGVRVLEKPAEEVAIASVRERAGALRSRTG